MTGLFSFLMNKVALTRPPDFVIGGHNNPYLHRWYVIPRNRLFNVYLHHFLRSDDDRALHDHPWFNVSILLHGSYKEETIKAGGIRVKRTYAPGLRSGIKFRSPWAAHRVELFLTAGVPRREQPVWTLFLTGPRLRVWGFHCPRGWKSFAEYARQTPGGSELGEGCGDLS